MEKLGYILYEEKIYLCKKLRCRDISYHGSPSYQYDVELMNGEEIEDICSRDFSYDLNEMLESLKQKFEIKIKEYNNCIKNIEEGDVSFFIKQG